MKNVTTKTLLLAALLIGLLTGLKAAPVQISTVAPVSFAEALQDAMMIAEAHGNTQVMCITGTSMLPFFGEGSLVLVKKIDAAKLKAGMVVVYRNNFGETVAHRLVDCGERGWVAQGFNNTATDSTPVTSENLLGVVYATFRTEGMPSLEQLAMAGGERLAFAMAAPAK